MKKGKGKEKRTIGANKVTLNAVKETSFLQEHVCTQKEENNQIRVSRSKMPLRGKKSR